MIWGSGGLLHQALAAAAGPFAVDVAVYEEFRGHDVQPPAHALANPHHGAAALRVREVRVLGLVVVLSATQVFGQTLAVRHAGGTAGKARLRALQWLLIEWPAGDAEQCKYVLLTLPETSPLNELVGATYQRWRIERGYQDGRAQ
jgi:hypothetical protein